VVYHPKHLRHAAAAAAADAPVHPHLTANADAGAAHVANGASIRQHAGNMAPHIVNKERHNQPADVGPRQQRVAVDTDNVNNDQRPKQHVVDNADKQPPRPPHAAVML